MPIYVSKNLENSPAQVLSQLRHWADYATRHYDAGLPIAFDPIFTIIAYNYTMTMTNTF